MTSPAASPAHPPTGSRSLVWPIVIVVVVIVGILAVVAARGSGDDEADAPDNPQTGTITVTGEPLAPLETSGTDPAVGEPIPTIAGTNFQGEATTIGPDDGAQIVLVVAHWCPHCQAEVPRLVDHLADQPMPDDVGLNLVSTSVEPEAENYPPQAWLDDEGWEYPILMDSDTRQAAQALGTPSFPYFVAVDAEGNVAARASGELSTEQFDDLVDLVAPGS